MKLLGHILDRFCRWSCVKCVKKRCISNCRSLFIACTLCWGLHDGPLTALMTKRHFMLHPCGCRFHAGLTSCGLTASFHCDHVPWHPAAVAGATSYEMRHGGLRLIKIFNPVQSRLLPNALRTPRRWSSFNSASSRQWSTPLAQTIADAIEESKRLSFWQVYS